MVRAHTISLALVAWASGCSREPHGWVVEAPWPASATAVAVLLDGSTGLPESSPTVVAPDQPIRLELDQDPPIRVLLRAYQGSVADGLLRCGAGLGTPHATLPEAQGWIADLAASGGSTLVEESPVLPVELRFGTCDPKISVCDSIQLSIAELQGLDAVNLREVTLSGSQIIAMGEVGESEIVVAILREDGTVVARESIPNHAPGGLTASPEHVFVATNLGAVFVLSSNDLRVITSYPLFASEARVAHFGGSILAFSPTSTATYALIPDPVPTLVALPIGTDRVLEGSDTAVAMADSVWIRRGNQPWDRTPLPIPLVSPRFAITSLGILATADQGTYFLPDGTTQWHEPPTVSPHPMRAGIDIDIGVLLLGRDLSARVLTADGSLCDLTQGRYRAHVNDVVRLGDSAFAVTNAVGPGDALRPNLVHVFPRE